MDRESHFVHREAEDFGMGIARMIVLGGWAEDMQLDLDRLFPDGRPAHPEEIAALPRTTADEAKCRSDTCPICLGVLEEPADGVEEETKEGKKEGTSGDRSKEAVLISMPCRHHFHSECILAWLAKNNSCPQCRTRLPDPLQKEIERQQKRALEREADLEELHNSMYS